MFKINEEVIQNMWDFSGGGGGSKCPQLKLEGHLHNFRMSLH